MIIFRWFSVASISFRFLSEALSLCLLVVNMSESLSPEGQRFIAKKEFIIAILALAVRDRQFGKFRKKWLLADTLATIICNTLRRSLKVGLLVIK